MLNIYSRLKVKGKILVEVKSRLRVKECNLWSKCFKSWKKYRFEAPLATTTLALSNHYASFF
jgi:hypothetical protein